MSQNWFFCWTFLSGLLLPPTLSWQLIEFRRRRHSDTVNTHMQQPSKVNPCCITPLVTDNQPQTRGWCVHTLIAPNLWSEALDLVRVRRCPLKVRLDLYSWDLGNYLKICLWLAGFHRSCYYFHFVNMANARVEAPCKDRPVSPDTSARASNWMVKR